MRTVSASLGLAALALVVCAAESLMHSAQTDGPSPSFVSTDLSVITLDPADPMSYFELAEQIGYEQRTDQAQRLATELVLMAWLLTPDPAERRSMQRSAALLLADLTATTEDRRRFLALAGVQSSDTPRVLAPPLRAVLDAIGAIRLGDWTSLRQSVRNFPPSAALVEFGVDPDDAREFLRLIDRYRDQPQQSIDRNSPESVFMTGPSLSTGDDRLLTRVEAALVGVQTAGWADAVLLTDDSPARLETLGAVAATLRLRAATPNLELNDDGSWTWQAVATATSTEQNSAQ